MAQITVVGPLKDRASAEETMRALGPVNHSVYSMNDGTDWFVERDTAIVPDRIVGLAWSTIQEMQQGK